MQLSNTIFGSRPLSAEPLQFAKNFYRFHRDVIANWCRHSKNNIENRNLTRVPELYRMAEYGKKLSKHSENPTELPMQGRLVDNKSADNLMSQNIFRNWIDLTLTEELIYLA